MAILPWVWYGGQSRQLIFSFLLRRASDGRAFLVKAVDISSVRDLTLDLLQELGTLPVGASQVALTVGLDGSAFSVGFKTSESSATFFEGTYPNAVTSRSIVAADFEPAFPNNLSTYGPLTIHEGAWGQAAITFGEVTFGDFQIQSFDATGVVEVSSGDLSEGSPGPDGLGQIAVRSFILPDAKLAAGESTAIGTGGRRLLCKNDLSAALYSIEGGPIDRYYNGTHNPLTRGVGVPSVQVLASGAYTNWQGDKIYQLSLNTLSIFDVDPTAFAISLADSFTVSLPSVPMGYEIVAAKCEFAAGL